MELKYTVSSCSEDPVEVMATVMGQEMPVKVMGLVVELISECGGMGHTYRLMPTDMADAKEKFAVGAEVILTFTFPEAE